MDQQYPLLSQKDQIKKVLLIVGRMGHGKSSFIKMLTQQRKDNNQYSTNLVQNKNVAQHDENEINILKNLEKKNQIIIRGGGKNGTNKCSLYQVHPSHQILQNKQQLFAIDTPGLDSVSAACLITQQIDELLIQESCEVIGIAYVIDIQQRQQGSNGHSIFGQFYRLLKIKDKYKRNLIFCVMTKWDKIYDSQQTKQQCLKNLREILKNQKCQEAFFTKIQWSSKPIKDFKIYKRKFIETQEGQCLIQRQWIQLKAIIKLKSRHICPYKEYIQDYKNYWKLLLKPLQQLYKSGNRSVAFKQQNFMFPIVINRKKINKKFKNLIAPIFTSGVLNITRFGFAFLIPSLALTGPIGISILTSTIILGTLWSAYQVRQILLQKFKYSYGKYSNKQENKQKQIKKELQQKIQEKIGSFLFDQFLRKIKIEDNSLKIPFDLYWLSDKIQAYYQNETEKFAEADKNNPIIHYNIKSNQNEVKIFLKTKIQVPQLHHIDIILKEIINKCYNQNQ